MAVETSASAAWAASLRRWMRLPRSLTLRDTPGRGSRAHSVSQGSIHSMNPIDTEIVITVLMPNTMPDPSINRMAPMSLVKRLMTSPVGKPSNQEGGWAIRRW